MSGPLVKTMRYLHSPLARLLEQPQPFSPLLIQFVTFVLGSSQRPHRSRQLISIRSNFLGPGHGFTFGFRSGNLFGNDTSLEIAYGSLQGVELRVRSTKGVVLFLGVSV